MSSRLNFSLSSGFRKFFYFSISLIFIGMMKYTFDGLHWLVKYKEFLSQPILFYAITLIAFIAFSALALSKRYFVINLIFGINIVFFIFLTSKIVIDTGDFERVNSILFSTASGIAFYYIFAALLSCLLSALYHDANLNPKKQKYFILFGFVQNIYYLCLVVLLSLASFGSFHASKFLISELGNSYQQPASMLSMVFCFTTLVTLLTQAVSKNFRPTLFMRILQRMSFFAYVISGFLTVLIMQAINSNKGALLIIAFVYLTIIFSFFISSRTLKSSLFSRLKIHSSKKVFFQITKYSFFTLSLMITAFFVLIFYFEPQNINMRLFDLFKDSGSSSLVSRAEILKLHFWDQASYSPIWGNVIVDEKLGLAGKYPHNMLLFSFTHLGLIGLVYFLFSVFLCCYNVLKTADFGIKNIHFMSNINRIVIVVIFLPTLLLGLIGTTMYWSVYWFVLGLVTPSISFTLYNNYASSKAVHI